MSRPRETLLDWVFDPAADDTDEQCDSVYRDRWGCVAPLGHVSLHWCPDGALPQTWWNNAPIFYKKPLDNSVDKAHTRDMRDDRDDLAMGYVACDWCGRPIEQHDTHGYHAEDCDCSEKWTVADIKFVRKQNGLPAKYNAMELI